MTTGVFEEHLQYVAEQLARALHRSVIIDDAALRPLATTAQTGRLDRSRVEAVLQRGTSARLRRRLAGLGVFSAREPVSIPGDPQLATLPRLCLPLRADDQLLGFLWLIDEPPLTTEQTRQARAAAAEAAHLLAQRAIEADGRFAVLSAVADGLLDPQEEVRREAATALAGQAALTGAPPYALAVIRPAPGRAAPSPDPGRAGGSLRRTAGNLRRRAAPGTLVLASPGKGELVAITTNGALAELPEDWAGCGGRGNPFAAGEPGRLRSPHGLLPERGPPCPPPCGRGGRGAGIRSLTNGPGGSWLTPRCVPASLCSISAPATGC